MTGRLKVLVSAYACSPYRGSEPGVGWGFVHALASHHDLWVIVEEKEFKEDIERFLAQNPDHRARIRFFFVRRTRNQLLRKLWPPSYYWYYRRWHQKAFRLAQELHRRIGFDIAHQLNMVGFREPGYLWKLGIPFVWGPVGGMGLFPWRFLTTVGFYGALYYFCYNFYNLSHMRFLVRPRLAAGVADMGLIAMNLENKEGLSQYFGAPSEICIPVGPPLANGDEIITRHPGEPIRFVWTGQHKPGKALNLALEALATVPDDIVWELHVLGEGRLTQRWIRQAKRLGLAERCYFYGWVSRERAIQVMRTAHVQIFTSLREGTPSVPVEAFSLGLPTICLDCSGMIDMVDETCGIKIPVTTPRAVRAGIAGAIAELAQDEEKRRRLALGALRRSRDFSWARKAEAVNEIYRLKIRNYGSAGVSGSSNRENVQ